MSVPGNF